MMTASLSELPQELVNEVHERCGVEDVVGNGSKR